MSAQSSKPRRSSPYDDDPMVRLTGLALDPDFPPSHHSASPRQSEVKQQNDQQQIKEEKTEAASPITPHPQQNEGDYITLRSLVTTREAGVIIGKGGKNVADIRDRTSVKAGVSKVVPGVHERVLTIGGSVDGVARAYGMVAKYILENLGEQPRPNSRDPASPDHTTVRLLVAHQLMGSVIGKGGARIREIQEESGCRIVISKDMLPQSTERVVDVYGLVDQIEQAVFSVADCLMRDADRGVGVILYSPENRLRGSSSMHHNPRSGGPRYDRDYENTTTSPTHRRRRSSFSSPPRTPTTTVPSDPTEERTQSLNVPADLIGCIIGKGGSFINSLRRTSGTKLRIDELQEGKDTRTVHITGEHRAVQRALGLIYQQLESEKARRLKRDEEMGGDLHGDE